MLGKLPAYPVYREISGILFADITEIVAKLRPDSIGSKRENPLHRKIDAPTVGGDIAVNQVEAIVIQSYGTYLDIRGADYIIPYGCRIITSVFHQVVCTSVDLEK
jgi:hypothetical protein